MLITFAPAGDRSQVENQTLNQVAIKVDMYSLYKAVQVLKSLALLYIPFIPEYTNTLRGQKYFSNSLVLQDEWLTIFTHPANTGTCPLKVYAIENSNMQYDFLE